MYTMTNIVALVVLLSITRTILVYGECQANGGPLKAVAALGITTLALMKRVQEYILLLTSVE